MVKKEGNGKKIEINLSNKLYYSLILIGIILFAGGIVYALSPGNAPNPGHLIDQVAPPNGCSAGQALTWNGNSWECGESGTQELQGLSLTDCTFEIYDTHTPSGAPDTCFVNLIYGCDDGACRSTYLKGVGETVAYDFVECMDRVDQKILAGPETKYIYDTYTVTEKLDPVFAGGNGYRYLGRDDLSSISMNTKYPCYVMKLS